MWVGTENDFYSAHIEISRKAYWALVKEAAEHEKDPEEYLENYIEVLWGGATPCKSASL